MLAVTVTLYYVTYPFPNRPKADTDPLSFLQHAMRRPPPIVEELTSPALSLWKTLNPERDPLVNIRIETPMVVALNTQGTSEPRRDVHRQDIRSNEHMARRAFWLLKIVILPIGTTTGCLYLLLLYLLKDAELLEAQRSRPEADSEDATCSIPHVEGNVTFTPLPRAFATDVEFIATNHDASVIAIVSTENELVVWNEGYHYLDVWDALSTGCSASGAESCITTVALDFSGQYCAIGTNSGVVCIWRIHTDGSSNYTDSCLTSVTLPASVTDLAFVSVDNHHSSNRSSKVDSHLSLSEEEFSVVAACDNAMAFQTDPRTWTTVRSIHPSHIDSVMRSHLLHTIDRGIFVAYTYYDGAVELFSPTDGYGWDSMCFILPGDYNDPVIELCSNVVKVDGAFGIVLGAATRAGTVSLWDPAKGERIFCLDGIFMDATQLRITPIISQPCQRCGEFTPDAFAFTFSVGHTVFVHRASLSSTSKRCTCPIKRRVFARESLGRRSRSGSMTTAKASPSRTRLKLPALSTPVAPADTSEFPVSGHGVRSRRASSEKDLQRRACETLPTIQSETERHETPSSSKGPPNGSIATSESIWRTLVVDHLTDITCERGSWDLIDGQQLIGLRRRSRLAQNVVRKPNSLTPPVPVGTRGLTASVLERWELWTFNPAKPDAGVRVSDLLAITPTSSSISKGSLHPRLPFTRVYPIVVCPSACVAGFGNTAGVIGLSHRL